MNLSMNVVFVGGEPRCSPCSVGVTCVVTLFDPCGYPFVGRHTGLPLRGFYNLYLFLCQSIQLIDQIINLPIWRSRAVFSWASFVAASFRFKSSICSTRETILSWRALSVESEKFVVLYGRFNISRIVTW